MFSIDYKLRFCFVSERFLRLPVGGSLSERSVTSECSPVGWFCMKRNPFLAADAAPQILFSSSLVKTKEGVDL